MAPLEVLLHEGPYAERAVARPARAQETVNDAVAEIVPPYTVRVRPPGQPVLNEVHRPAFRFRCGKGGQGNHCIEVAQEPSVRDGHAQAIIDPEVCAEPRPAVMFQQPDGLAQRARKQAVRGTRPDRRCHLPQLLCAGGRRHAGPEARYPGVQAVPALDHRLSQSRP